MVGIGILANIIIFLVCTWAILSHKVRDGVLIKLGLIILSFTSLNNVVSLGVTAYVVPCSIAMALIGVGAFLRVEVYPRLSKRVSFIHRLSSLPLLLSASDRTLNRRSSDTIKDGK